MTKLATIRFPTLSARKLRRKHGDRQSRKKARTGYLPLAKFKSGRYRYLEARAMEGVR